MRRRSLYLSKALVVLSPIVAVLAAIAWIESRKSEDQGAAQFAAIVESQMPATGMRPSSTVKPGQSGWSASDLIATAKPYAKLAALRLEYRSPGVHTEVALGWSTLHVSPPATILQIVGTFSVPGGREASFSTSQITVVPAKQSGSEEPNRRGLSGFGITQDEVCNCRELRDLEQLESGLATLTFFRPDGNVAGRVKLSRAGSEDPFKVTPLDNPSRLCLMFLVPWAPARGFVLHFADTEIPFNRRS